MVVVMFAFYKYQHQPKKKYSGSSGRRRACYATKWKLGLLSLWHIHSSSLSSTTARRLCSGGSKLLQYIVVVAKSVRISGVKRGQIFRAASAFICFLVQTKFQLIFILFPRFYVQFQKTTLDFVLGNRKYPNSSRAKIA